MISDGEFNFLLSHINKEISVLEYGSGVRSAEIANRCKFLTSVEHHFEWYDLIRRKLPDNSRIVYAPPDTPYAGSHDGTYEEFRTYIECPSELKPWDLVLIDGRARIECAAAISRIAPPNTTVFIHDFHSRFYSDSYGLILDSLQICESFGDMARFRTK